jgi:hypothetical protein
MALIAIHSMAFGFLPVALPASGAQFRLFDTPRRVAERKIHFP